MGLCSAKPTSHAPYTLHVLSEPPNDEIRYEAGGKHQEREGTGPALPHQSSPLDRRVNEIVGSEEARERAQQGWRKLKREKTMGTSPSASARAARGERGGRGAGRAGAAAAVGRTPPRRGGSDSNRDSPGLRGPPSSAKSRSKIRGLPSVPGRSTSRFGFGDLEDESIIGVGGIAHVRLMTLKTDSPQAFAVKIMHKREMVARRMVRYVRREADILTLLAESNSAGRGRHDSTGSSGRARSDRGLLRRREAAGSGESPAGCPFFVSLKARIQDNARVGLVLDFVHGGDLYGRLRRVGRFPEDVAKFYTAELVEAIDFMHSLRIAYRDLKPENVLIDAHGHIRVTDFGFAKVLDAKGRCLTRVGTPHYLAPEQLDKRNKEGYTEIVDWWALGCLVYEMLVGKPCFGSSRDSSYEVYTRIMSGKPPSFPLGTNKHVRDLVRRLLIVSRDKRLKSAPDLRSHAWFAGTDWEAVKQRRLAAPFVPPLSGPTDCRHFDMYEERDTDYVTGRRKREKWSSKKKGDRSEDGKDVEDDTADEPLTVGGKDPFAFF